MAIQTVLDFYQEVYTKNILAQRNAYQIYFTDKRGDENDAEFNAIWKILPHFTAVTSKDDADTKLKSFNLRIESVTMPDAASLETNESGAIWISNKLPQDSLQMGNTLTFNLFDVKDSPADTAFYRWLKLVNKPKWSDKVPFPTATIVLDFYGVQTSGITAPNASLELYARYTFYGCYPYSVDLPSTTTSVDTLVGNAREVKMNFAAYSVWNVYDQVSS